MICGALALAAVSKSVHYFIIKSGIAALVPSSSGLTANLLDGMQNIRSALRIRAHLKKAIDDYKNSNTT